MLETDLSFYTYLGTRGVLIRNAPIADSDTFCYNGTKVFYSPSYDITLDF